MVIPDYILTLAEHGIEITIEPFTEIYNKEKPIHHGICIAVSGFYKNSKIHLVRSGGFAEFGLYKAIGRYGYLREVETLEDLVELNYSEWRRYEHKGFEVDSTWAALLQEKGFIRKVTTTTVSYVPA